MLPIIISLIFMCEFAIPTLLFSIVNTQWRWKVLIIIMILFYFLFNWQLSFYQFSFCQMNHKRWFWSEKKKSQKVSCHVRRTNIILYSLLIFRVKITKYHLFLFKLSFMVMINYYSRTFILVEKCHGKKECINTKKVWLKRYFVFFILFSNCSIFFYICFGCSKFVWIYMSQKSIYKKNTLIKKRNSNNH